MRVDSILASGGRLGSSKLRTSMYIAYWQYAQISYWPGEEDWVVRSSELASTQLTGNTCTQHTRQIGQFETPNQHVHSLLAIRIDSILAWRGRLGRWKLRTSMYIAYWQCVQIAYWPGEEDWVVRSSKLACTQLAGNACRQHTGLGRKIGQFEAPNQHVHSLLAIRVHSILAWRGRLGSLKLRTSMYIACWQCVQIAYWPGEVDWVVRSSELACTQLTGNACRQHTGLVRQIGQFEAPNQHVHSLLAMRVDSILSWAGRLGSSKLRTSMYIAYWQYVQIAYWPGEEDWVVRSSELTCTQLTGNACRQHTGLVRQIGQFEAPNQHVHSLLAIRVDIILAWRGRLGSSKLRTNMYIAYWQCVQIAYWSGEVDWVVRSSELACTQLACNTFRQHTVLGRKIGQFKAPNQYVHSLLAIRVDSILAWRGRLGSSKLRTSMYIAYWQYVYIAYWPGEEDWVVRSSELACTQLAGNACRQHTGLGRKIGQFRSSELACTQLTGNTCRYHTGLERKIGQFEAPN